VSGCFFASDLGLGPTGNLPQLLGILGLPRQELSSSAIFEQAGWNTEIWGFPLGKLPRHRWADTRPVAAINAIEPALIVNPEQTAQIKIDASASYDPDGDQLSFNWTWSDRTFTTLEPNIAIPVADLLHGENAVVLTVSDGTSDSDPVGVTVWVDRPPMARIFTPDPYVDPARQSSIYVYGSASMDPDGDPISFTWNWSGQEVSTETINWIQIPVDKLSHGQNTITLKVDDGIRASEPASLTVVKNTPPQAVISQADNIVVAPGQDLVVDGSQTSDPDGDALTYIWCLNGRPIITKIGDSNVIIPAAMLDQRINSLVLTVHDCMPGFAPGIAAATVRVNSPPVVDAGPDQVVFCPIDTGAEVSLRAVASDQDGDTLTYRWLEDGQVIATGLSSSAMLDVGLHQIVLEVDDGYGVVTDTVDVNVIGPEAARDLKVSPGLIGRASQCPDVRFYLCLPKGMGLSDLDLSGPIRLYLVGSDGHVQVVGDLVKDSRYQQKRHTLVGSIARHRLLSAIGPDNGRYTLKVSAQTRSGPYLVGTAEVTVVSGSGPSLLQIRAERLGYWLSLP
jgi:hypothetical protein